MAAPDSLRSALARLGLGRHEATLYATLVERSPLGASSLAKATGLARSSVYTALASLTARGLVGTTHDEGVKRFVAEGHAALIDAMKREEERARERARLAEELAPHFAARTLGEGGRLPHVVHFEGIEGLERVYLTMLRQAPRGATMSIVRDEFLWTPEWAFVSSDPWRQRVRSLRAARDIDTRLLVNASPIEADKAPAYDQRPHLEWRFLSPPMQVKRFAIYVLGEVVAVMSTEERNLVGIQIANANLAANFAALFDSLWAGARAPGATRPPPRKRARRSRRRKNGGE